MAFVIFSHTHLEEQDIEAPKVKSPPSIDLKPEPVEVQEGFPAKFLVRVSGYPRPRVNWFVNGSLIVSVSIFIVNVSIFIVSVSIFIDDVVAGIYLHAF